jgi:hypothetical protein
MLPLAACLLTGLLAAPAPSAPAGSIDLAFARRSFQELAWASQDDGGRLWGVPLAGPTLLFDPATGDVVANQPDAEGRLQPVDDDAPNRHLATREGRTWLLLEFRALSSALPADGRLEYELRHPRSDGTTTVVFEPSALLGRLAVLVPPPRAHLLTDHGVLAPRPGRHPWADLLRRAFGLEVLRCPGCGGRRPVRLPGSSPPCERGSFRWRACATSSWNRGLRVALMQPCAEFRKRARTGCRRHAEWGPRGTLKSPPSAPVRACAPLPAAGGVSCAVRWPAGRSEEVIRVSQWAEIRQMHWVDGVPRKEVARRLGLDVKTVRRALGRDEMSTRRVSPARGCRFDPLRARERSSSLQAV